MNGSFGGRLEMAVRVRDFMRAHPSTDANFAAVLARLEELIDRLEALAKQQQDGGAARTPPRCGGRHSAGGCTTGCCGTW